MILEPHTICPRVLGRWSLQDQDRDRIALKPLAVFCIFQSEGRLPREQSRAFQEAEAISLGTKCNQYLFSLSLNPPPNVDVAIEDFEAAITDIEKQLGLAGQPRAIVFHENRGGPYAVSGAHLPEFRVI